MKAIGAFSAEWQGVRQFQLSRPAPRLFKWRPCSKQHLGAHRIHWLPVQVQLRFRMSEHCSIFPATCRLWTPTLARHSPGLLCLTQCYQILFQPARFVAGIPPQMIHETQPHRHPPAASPSVPPASPANGTLKLRTDSSPVPPPECMHAEVMRYCGENA